MQTTAPWPQPARSALPHESLSATQAPVELRWLAVWLPLPALPLLELLPALCRCSRGSELVPVAQVGE